MQFCASWPTINLSMFVFNIIQHHHHHHASSFTSFFLHVKVLLLWLHYRWFRFPLCLKLHLHPILLVVLKDFDLSPNADQMILTCLVYVLVGPSKLASKGLCVAHRHTALRYHSLIWQTFLVRWCSAAVGTTSCIITLFEASPTLLVLDSYIFLSFHWMSLFLWVWLKFLFGFFC